MMWFSIRRIRLLGVAVVMAVLAGHVQAHAADGRSGQIAGTVLDGKGPLADHRVQLRVRVFSGGLRTTQLVATTVTDASGRFTFTCLAPGIFEVTVLRDETRVRTSAPIHLSAGAMDQTVRLQIVQRRGGWRSE